MVAPSCPTRVLPEGLALSWPRREAPQSRGWPCLAVYLTLPALHVHGEAKIDQASPCHTSSSRSLPAHRPLSLSLIREGRSDLQQRGHTSDLAHLKNR